MARLQDLEIENAEITFLNFEGRETDYNTKGDRNFSVVIPSLEQAIALHEAGWNVQVRPKKKETRDAMKAQAHNFEERIAFLETIGELEDAMFHLKVIVSYKYEDKAPVVWIYSNLTKKHRRLDESTIYTLDSAEIENIDLIINPSWYNRAGRTGYTAYLKEAHVTIRESRFREKYKEYYEDDEI